MRRPISCVLLLITFAPCALAQSGNSTSSPSGLELLQQVSRHYANARSYRIEAVEESTSTGEFEHTWQKSILSAAEAEGNRYYYEGRSNAGGAIRMSDGKTIWNYHIDEHTYTAKKASDTATSPQQPLSWVEAALLRSQNIRRSLSELASHYKSADRLPDATIAVNGHEFPCYVVRVKSSDMKRAPPNRLSEHMFWVDKTHQTIVQSVYRSDTYVPSGSARIPMKGVLKTTYTLVELDTQLPESFFSLIPPSNAKLLPNFPNPLNNNGGADLTGQMAPPLKLKSQDGKLLSLDSLRGKPVLLDVWATWCAPCVKSLPQLSRLYQETKDKGLALITVDTDEEAKTAAALLAKGGYQWPNFHDDGGVSDALGVNGIPRTLLIDSTGKVVFDKTDSGDNELRTQISKLGPEYASLEPKPEPAPCEATK